VCANANTYEENNFVYYIVYTSQMNKLDESTRNVKCHLYTSQIYEQIT